MSSNKNMKNCKSKIRKILKLMKRTRWWLTRSGPCKKRMMTCNKLWSIINIRWYLNWMYKSMEWQHNYMKRKVRWVNNKRRFLHSNKCLEMATPKTRYWNKRNRRSWSWVNPSSSKSRLYWTPISNSNHSMGKLKRWIHTSKCRT